METIGGIGVPGTSQTTLSLEEHESLARAVRETVKRDTLDVLRRRGPIPTAELIECPGCGDRVIHIDSPPSYVFDRDRNARICKACGAERDFIQMVRPDADIGGEGGG
ncbi:MAG TPA: hypothetical protein VGB52_05835 [Actinomycetota bacterium]